MERLITRWALVMLAVVTAFVIMAVLAVSTQAQGE